MHYSSEKRILLVTSNRSKWLETASDKEHVDYAPYSVGAILYNLSRMGWITSRSGWKTSCSLLKLAKKIDQFKPDIVYTYGSTVALNPLLCRKLVCTWKDFKVVHGWDDAYGDIWNNFLGTPGRIFMNAVEQKIITQV